MPYAVCDSNKRPTVNGFIWKWNRKMLPKIKILKAANIETTSKQDIDRPWRFIGVGSEGGWQWARGIIRRRSNEAERGDSEKDMDGLDTIALSVFEHLFHHRLILEWCKFKLFPKTVGGLTACAELFYVVRSRKLSFFRLVFGGRIGRRDSIQGMHVLRACG